ncbi:MAG: intradiol ring-cleavage dioxygenase [Aggregatilineales bacterium]
MNEKSNHITRRKFLLYVSALSPALAIVALKGRVFSGLTLAQAATPAPTVEATALACVASPSMTEGPYFVDEMLKRVDIRVDPTDNAVKPGVPLKLAITLFSVNGNVCSPLKGAQVDIWHCDAAGLYSDEAANNTVGKKFLRGYQVTDDNGLVNFTTIYPGWYQGRTVHIHVKVRTFAADGTASYAFNSQMFFDDSLSDAIHAQPPYSAHGKRNTTNATDMVFNGTDQGTADPHDMGEKMLLTLTKDSDGYASSVYMGVDLSKPSPSSNGGPDFNGGPGGGPPPGGNPPGGPGNGQPPPGGPGFGTPPATSSG